jgi:hypothetical protein
VDVETQAQFRTLMLMIAVCGSLADGDHRYPRKDGELCKCKDGWGGINCNGEWGRRTSVNQSDTLVCKNDKGCKGFKLRNPGENMADPDDGDDDDEENDMVCYKGGLAIEQNFQMCDVTNRKIRDTIPDNKPPQVTFSCTKGGPRSNTTDLAGVSSLGFYDNALEGGDEMGTCGFQFWVDRKESFYCKLEQCQWEAPQGPETNETRYHCEKIACSCIPGRFLCGENGSVSE